MLPQARRARRAGGDDARGGLVRVRVRVRVKVRVFSLPSNPKIAV